MESKHITTVANTEVILLEEQATITSIIISYPSQTNDYTSATIYLKEYVDGVCKFTQAYVIGKQETITIDTIQALNANSKIVCISTVAGIDVKVNYDSSSSTSIELSSPTDMTSNENTDWVISASQAKNTQYSWHVFDGVYSTLWESYDYNYLPQWIQWRNKSKKVLVKKIILQNPEGRFVTNMSFQGSNDGTTWTDIANHLVITPLIKQTVTFPDNVTSYYYHRFTINANTRATEGNMEYGALHQLLAYPKI